jgi:hypothetical protein
MDIIAIIAILMQAITLLTPIVYVSRIFMGFYCAITTGLVPSYTLSLTPSFTTGIFGVFNQIAIVTGMTFAYLMAQFLNTELF